MSFRAVGLWRPIPRLVEIVVQDDGLKKIAAVGEGAPSQ